MPWTEGFQEQDPDAGRGGRDSKCAGVQGIAKPKGDCWQTPGISSHSLNSGLGHDGVQQSLNLP